MILRSRWTVALLATFALGLALLTVRAAEDAGSEAGFVPLFNGKDLSGWMYGTWGNDLNKMGAGYAVRDGVVYCTPTDGGDLYTEKEYGDFVLRFEFKLTPNANNGIGIRAPGQGDAAYVGMEIQVLDDSGSWYHNLRPWQYHGSIYNVVPAQRGHLKPVGEWNEEEITAIGPHITVKVNGAVNVDANLDDIKDPEVHRFHSGLKRAAGHIGLLGHESRVDFRNMRIREVAVAAR